MCPGLSGLLVRHLADQLASSDEIHIAVHGTAGPACARQHHRALAGQRRWRLRDGDWVRRPAGSGRELCWFPEPVGAYDCYRGRTGVAAAAARAVPRRDAHQRPHVGEPSRPPDGAAADAQPSASVRVASGHCASRFAAPIARVAGAPRRRDRRTRRHRRGRDGVGVPAGGCSPEAFQPGVVCAGDARLDTGEPAAYDRAWSVSGSRSSPAYPIQPGHVRTAA